jgi:hypothetical protein
MGAWNYAPICGWTINGLFGVKLHHHREFPHHFVPEKDATLCRLSSFAHSSKRLQVSELDSAGKTDAGLRKRNGRRAGGDKYPGFAKSERSRVFRPNSAYDRLGAKGQKSVNLEKAVLTRECINIVAKRLQDSGKMTWLRLASSQTRMGF